jgi:hypothetical protein
MNLSVGGGGPRTYGTYIHTCNYFVHKMIGEHLHMRSNLKKLKLLQKMYCDHIF